MSTDSSDLQSPEEMQAKVTELQPPGTTSRLINWFKRERPYLLMFFAMAVASSVRLESTVTEEKPAAEQAAGSKLELSRFNDLVYVWEAIEDNPEGMLAMGLLSLLIFIALASGTAIFLWWMISLFFGNNLLGDSKLLPKRWGLWDVVKSFGFYFFMVVVTRSMIELISLHDGGKVFIDGFSKLQLGMLLQVPASILVCPFIVYVMHVEHGQPLEEIGVRPEWRPVGLGVLGYLGALPVVTGAAVLSLFIALFLDIPQESHPLAPEVLLAGDLGILVPVIIFACVLAPVWEELFFRGLLYPVLRKWLGVPAGMTISAVVFSLVHFNLFQFLPITVLGILLALLYEKTNSLWSSITAHAVFNSGSMFALLILRYVMQGM